MRVPAVRLFLERVRDMLMAARDSWERSATPPALPMPRWHADGWIKNEDRFDFEDTLTFLREKAERDAKARRPAS